MSRYEDMVGEAARLIKVKAAAEKKLAAQYTRWFVKWEFYGQYYQERDSTATCFTAFIADASVYGTWAEADAKKKDVLAAHPETKGLLIVVHDPSSDVISE